MLHRKPKMRYLLISTSRDTNNVVEAITDRCSKLFGSINAEKASIKLVSSNSQTIIRCGLDQLDEVLVSIALTQPPILVLDMSGTLKRLRKRLAKI